MDYTANTIISDDGGGGVGGAWVSYRAPEPSHSLQNAADDVVLGYRAKIESIATRVTRLFEKSTESSWLKPIEGMRGFAAFLVFFVHFDALFCGYVRRGSPTFMVSRFAGAFGNTGVDMFFVISGFLIYGILVRRSPRYRNFMWRRIMRLYPVFLFVFVIYLTISLSSPSLSKIPPGVFAAIVFVSANLLMLPGMVPIRPMIVVAWSLSYELFFYASLPLIVYSVNMRHWPPAIRVLFFATLVILYYSACVAEYAHHPRLIMFIAGIILYETMYNSRIPGRLPLRLDYLAIIVTVASLALTGIHIIGRGQPTKMLVALPAESEVLLFISFFSLALCAIAHDGILSRFLSLRWIRWFGNISYSYYLTHGMTLHGLQLLLRFLHFRGGLGPFPFFAIEAGCFLVTILIAAFVYFLIEQPFSLAKRSSPTNMKAKDASVVRAV